MVLILCLPYFGFKMIQSLEVHGITATQWPDDLFYLTLYRVKMKTSLRTKDINKHICISPRSKFISSFDKDLVIFDHSRFFDTICSCRKFANYFTITFITCQPVLTRKIVSFARNRVRNEDWISLLLNIHHDVCDKPLSRCQPANGLEPSCQIRIL